MLRPPLEPGVRLPLACGKPLAGSNASHTRATVPNSASSQPVEPFASETGSADTGSAIADPGNANSTEPSAAPESPNSAAEPAAAGLPAEEPAPHQTSTPPLDTANATQNKSSQASPPPRIPLDRRANDYRPPWAWREERFKPAPTPSAYSEPQRAKPPWLANLPLAYPGQDMGTRVDCHALWGGTAPPELPPVDPDHVLKDLSADRWQLARRTCVDPRGSRPHLPEDWALLKQLHVQLHAIFSNHFLKALAELPAQHPLNDPSLRTTVDIAIDTQNLKLQSLVVFMPSKQPLFDVIALESLLLAFHRLPDGLRDTNTNPRRLRWELHRDPIYACSTYLVKPLNR